MHATAFPSAARLFTVRGIRVILDSDLAVLYGVPTKRLNEKVRRNPERFPQDFVFLLSTEEWESLRAQIAASNNGRGSRRKFLPYAFTEHGALMAAGLLNSRRAIESSIHIIRTFFVMQR
jgi:ORF6N domain-containing protein